jgi:proline dehydrogenase
MLRAGLLYLSEQPSIFRFIRSNALAKKLSSRFVAGETLDTAVSAVKELNAQGITASLDLLGESVHSAEAARAAARTATLMLDRIAALKLKANISVKLTQFGLDADPKLCAENLHRLLDRGRELGIFVRIDMESTEYTQRTLELFSTDLRPAYGDGVGVVIQSMLRRSKVDVEQLVASQARVRLCKGAYQEPPMVAFPDKRDVDRSYSELMEMLLERGNYPGIATHDEALIARAKGFAKDHAIGRERFEFQMLYGVRRDLQRRLVREGYHVRVYVPFGTQWYPYLMRRLAERPANIAFILGNVLKEGARS